MYLFCDVFSHVPKEKKSKLDPKSRKCVFLGFENTIKGYKLWDLTNHKVIICRVVISNEKSMQGKEVQHALDIVPIEVKMHTNENENKHAEASNHHEEQ